MSSNIDFVITWVNGNDSNWKNKKFKYLSNDDVYSNDTIQRYRDFDTLRFLLRSIEKYATWVNKIFLVTDNQKPEWLKNTSKLIVIDHKDIIPQEFLPVFNSNVIEWYINRIPGLSEKFVYFNDDVILNDYVTKKDFFSKGYPVDFRIYTDTVPLKEFNYIEFNNNILMNKYISNDWPKETKGLMSVYYGKQGLRNFFFELQAKKTGIPGYLEGHGPMPFLKKSFQIAQKIWDKEIQANSTHRFRSKQDISIWLIRHLQLELGLFTPGKYGLNTYCSLNDIKKIKKTVLNSLTKTVCLNDDSDDVENVENVIDILLKKFPKKSNFEKIYRGKS